MFTKLTTKKLAGRIRKKKFGRQDSGKIHEAGRRDLENNFGWPAGFGKIFSIGRRNSENNFRAKKPKCGSNQRSGHDD